MAKANSNPKDVMDQLNRLQADLPAENKPVRVMCLVELAKVAIQLEKNSDVGDIVMWVTSLCW